MEDSLDPALSKIVLAKGDDTVEDGYLYAYEVNNMPIHADMVVLASCFSGAGKIAKGEGVMSMGRSFINAGCSSLIISLWSTAADPAFSELKTFYRELIRGKSRAEALRLAKLKFLNDADPINANPRYWSSLVLVGDPGTLYKGLLLKIVFLPIGLIILLLAFLVVKRLRS